MFEPIHMICVVSFRNPKTLKVVETEFLHCEKSFKKQIFTKICNKLFVSKTLYLNWSLTFHLELYKLEKQIRYPFSCFRTICKCTVVVAYINTMKTPFYFNFELLNNMNS